MQSIYQLVDRYNGKVRAEGYWGRVATERTCMPDWERERMTVLRIGEPVILATFGFNKR